MNHNQSGATTMMWLINANTQRIPAAAHAAITKGEVLVGNGTFSFGAWSFPATPGYLLGFFNIISQSILKPTQKQISSLWLQLLILQYASNSGTRFSYSLTW